MKTREYPSEISYIFLSLPPLSYYSLESLVNKLFAWLTFQLNMSTVKLWNWDFHNNFETPLQLSGAEFHRFSLWQRERYAAHGSIHSHGSGGCVERLITHFPPLCNWADANAPQWIQWGAMRATDEARACTCAWIRNEKVNCAVIN